MKKWAENNINKLDKNTFWYAFKIIYSNNEEDFGFDTDDKGKNLIKELPPKTKIFRFSLSFKEDIEND